MSQNVTLSASDWQDIAKIKGYLLRHMNQTQIAKEIGKRRETVNKKIARWMQTDDFDEWANTLWLEQYGEISLEDKKEAFRQLTKLLCAKQTRKIKAETTTSIHEVKELIVDVNVFSDDEKSILDKAAAILDRKMQGKSDSIH